MLVEDNFTHSKLLITFSIIDDEENQTKICKFRWTLKREETGKG